MKNILNLFKYFVSLVMVAVLAACASTGQGAQDMAIAAGFKVITPTTAQQKAILPTLPEGKVTQINHDGKIYYVLPDAKNNQAFVGGPSEYQAYQQMRLAKKMSDDNLAAAQMNQMSQMNWGMWGGWGGVGGFRY